MANLYRSERAVVRLAPIILCLAVATGCSSPAPDEQGYVKEIEMERAAKDAAFADPNRDPKIPKARQSDYLPLAYYPIDPVYHVPASLKPAESRVTIQMPTSTGIMRTMQRVGVLDFMLNGRQFSLAAFSEADSVRLFVPFKDETSKSETYPAGRYLELDPTATGLYEVDFNRAFNPSCYFNYTYECPYPPPENRLSIAVRAGEKLSAKKRAELNPAN